VIVSKKPSSNNDAKHIDALGVEGLEASFVRILRRDTATSSKTTT